MPQQRQRFVLFIPDGAADRDRSGGRSPLAAAATPNCDFVARAGVSGRVTTLHPGLPRESMVAQLGILGWDPLVHYPHGRSSCELLALSGAYLGAGDLAFRANLVRMAGPVLESYSAGFIESDAARPLVERVDGVLRREFPDFELFHNSDFRNTLVVRGAGLDPASLVCPEPHEHQGEPFDLADLVRGHAAASQALAGRLNRYLARAAELLAGEAANALFPWSASRAFHLPPFAAVSGFAGRVAIVGFMDFLMGIARAGGIDFHRLGNGRPDTDYRAKGEKVVELLAAGYELVVCHVNAPDEASHMGDRELKIRSLEAFDRDVVGPAVRYFRDRPDELGGVMIVPDHYTNHAPEAGPGRRAEAHSLDPVPFCLWNGRDRDGVTAFSEDAAADGALGGEPAGHLDLLRILGVGRSGEREAARAGGGVQRRGGRPAATLADCVLRHADERPERLAYVYLRDGEEEEARLCWGELDRRARAIAAHLAAAAAMGDRALLLLPPRLDFIASFFGCLYAGLVAVPCPPPQSPRSWHRLEGILRDSDPRVVLISRQVAASWAELAARSPAARALRCLLIEDVADDLAGGWRRPELDPEAIAFLQYTSGSTSTPKGVMVSHANLLHNQPLVTHAWGGGADCTLVNWLPLYHDLGLIGAVLKAAYDGSSCVVLAPGDFVKRPLRWLRAISRYRGVVAGGPNFAYELCVDRITPEERAGLDLSSWRVAYNGAEPIRPRTMERFTAAYSAYGFDPRHWVCCYGLAEATLIVAGATRPREPVVGTYRGLDAGRAEPAAAAGVGAWALASSGPPIPGQDVRIVDPEARRELAEREIGEIWLASGSVTRGYWNRPEETAETFGALLADGSGAGFLRTGDLGFLDGGELFIAGRLKDLIILRGRNVYPQDVEATAESVHPDLRRGCGAAFAVETAEGEALVVVQEIAADSTAPAAGVLAAIRQAIAAEHEVETHALVLVRPREVPKTTSGKIQRRACRALYLAGSLGVVGAWQAPAAAPEAGREEPAPAAGRPGAAEIEAWLVRRLAEILRIAPADVRPREPLASHGLGSLQAATLAGDLERWLGIEVPETLAYDHPTVAAIARHLSGQAAPAAATAPQSAAARVAIAEEPITAEEPIAIVGIACRFPGAGDRRAFWRLLRDGVDAIREVPPERWDAAALFDPDLAAPGKMNSRWGGILDGADLFDAQFFGISPAEAERMDPQQRLLLEVTWEALEDGGISPTGLAGSRTGVYIGISGSDYGALQMREPDGVAAATGTGNALSIAANRLSYFLDLRGPSLAVDTACSSSLTAVHLACASLHAGESELALVGGVNLTLLPGVTVIFSKAGLLAPDGRCKAFDARADGYVRSEGVGIVVLKPLSRALADGDRVYALVRGSAIGQDGRSNGLTAPSRQAQEAVLRQAYRDAGVDPSRVDYVEAHGSGTALGDPIEAHALAAVVGEGRPADRPCRIGSVKTNLGHLEAAAGIAGLIKVALALDRGELPPSLHFRQPNPRIAFERLRLAVQRDLAPWPAGEEPALAGVSSFGFGGTNVHVVLSGAPRAAAAPMAPVAPPRSWQLLPLSARSAAALEAATADLATYLEEEAGAGTDGEAGTHLADVAHTLQTGRSAFKHRRFALCRDQGEAVRVLATRDPERVLTRAGAAGELSLAFLLPGIGDQYAGMARGLYRGEAVFRAELDRCAELLAPRLGLDLRDVLFPADAAEAGAASGPAGGLDLRKLLRPAASGAGSPLAATRVAQPAVFAVEIALARQLAAWGLRPAALLGHSLGEYAAACLAGVFTLEDALALVAERARLIAELPVGGMLAVALAEEEVRPLLGGDLSLAAVNTPSSCVLAGPEEALVAAERSLAARGAICRRIHTTHAFHSRAMEPVAGALAEAVAGVARRAPEVPFLSNVTGTWITAEEAVDPRYWARHLVSTVRFADGAAELLRGRRWALLEVGPGFGLGSFVKQHPGCEPSHVVLATMRHAQAPGEDQAALLTAVGRLWLAGVTPDWAGLAGPGRRRVALPTYPFERQRFWLQPKQQAAELGAFQELRREPDVADWFYRPVWKPAPPAGGGTREAGPWLVLADEGGFSAALAERLERAGRTLVVARGGTGFAALPDGTYRLAPGSREDWSALLRALRGGPGLPRRIVHLWTLDPLPEGPSATRLEHALDRGFYSLIALIQALGELGAAAGIDVVSRGLFPATGEEELVPELATLAGPCRVLPSEHPDLSCRLIDLASTSAPALDLAAPSAPALDQLAAELEGGREPREPREPIVALRGRQRWVPGYERVRLPGGQRSARLRERGVYLITGGLGGLGLAMAEHLGRTLRARLVLVGRHGLPPRATWQARLAAADATAEKIRRVLAIESAGGEVEVVAADVSRRDQMAAAVRRGVERFGAIDGALHAAGVPGAGIIQLKERAAAAAVLAPKVAGTLVLEEVLAGQAPDFLVLFSSVSAIIGGPGQVDYCAANAFLDAFAHSRGAGARPILSLDWCEWQWDAWQDALLGFSPQVQAAFRDHRRRFGIRFEEGAEALERALSRALPQLVVSPTPLDRLIEMAGSFPVTDLEARLRSWLRPGESAAVSAGPRRFERPRLDTAYVPPGNDLERRVAGVWQRALGVELGIHDNFFDLGGNSLVGVQVMAELSRGLGLALSSVVLFEAPTVARMTDLLAGRLGSGGRQSAALAPAAPRSAPVSPASAAAGGREVAIVGLAGRFPGAGDVWTLWSNLCAGRESLSFFTDEELAASGVDPALLADPSYVRARPIMEDADRFDASFFGFSPREALFMDPQHRVFLECSSNALETAGYDPLRYPGAIGMFAGSSLSTYMLGFYSDRELRDAIDPVQMVVGNDKDSLATAVSYRLNLRGPSLAVQTYCSTSLVAVHLACQSLLSEECSMALAGGVSVRAPQRFGYRYQEGGQESADGHTRAFDARATGTVFGDGAAVVVLKRLADALADGDTVYAVIKGSSINNDGSLKAGFTAPSVEGQALAVEAALARAGVSAESISYVEAHGSATPLGDPIEVAALTRAFRRSTGRQGFCALGSVKTNIGHIDRAAGAAGLIKTALALREGMIPPSLHFESPNPELGLAESPFFVNTELRPWPAGDGPRRAGVNSLGMGGTNAHVILEEAPPAEASGPSRPWQLLPLAARSATALDAAAALLAAALERSPELPLADVAYTLQVGRRQLEHRRVVLCADREGALAALAGGDPQRVWSRAAGPRRRRVAFLLPGLGDHYPGMALGLYRHEPAFRRHFDRCAEAVAPFGVDLVDLLYPELEAEKAPARPAVDLRGDARDRGPLSDTVRAHAALFAVEYVLARLWMEWGLTPDAMLGYSLGEYVAACLAGVMELDAALRLVCERARLIDELPEGGMLAVPLAPAELGGLLDGELALAAVNGPELCVVSGPAAALEALAARCAGRGVACRRLEIERAFHSAALEAIVPRLLALFEGVELSPPQIPYVANLTGTWVTPGQATDPRFWAAQMCGTVLFEPGIAALLAEPDRLLLEVGPGQSLTSFVEQHPACAERSSPVFPSLRAADEERADQEFLLAALGKLWLAGAAIDWPAYSAGERRRRVALPTYPFERERFWLEPKQQAAARPAAAAVAGDKRAEVAEWFYAPAWSRSAVAVSAGTAGTAGVDRAASRRFLLLADEQGVARALAAELACRGHAVALAEAGEAFAVLGPHAFAVRPGSTEDAARLADELLRQEVAPEAIVHLWGLTGPEGEPAGIAQELDRGFFGVLAVAQALSRDVGPAALAVVADGLHAIAPGEAVTPGKAPLVGLLCVLGQELPGLVTRSIDVVCTGEDPEHRQLAGRLADELLAAGGEPAVAFRGEERWVEGFVPRPLARPQATGLRPGGVVLVTGGLGAVGSILAERWARRGARLALVGRTPLPPRERWSEWLGAHEPDDATAQRIRRVQALEGLGAEVLTIAADAGDRDQLARAFAAAEDRFGGVHGVVHAAGSVDPADFGSVLTLERNACAPHFGPKIAGTLALAELLAGRDLDFCALVSSLSTVLGGLGFAAYAAANSFLDAMAHEQARQGRPWIAVDWDGWPRADGGAGGNSVGATTARFEMTPDEGFDAFERSLAALAAGGASRLVVSTGDLDARLRLWLRPGQSAAVPASALRLFERPQLDTAYVPPGNDLQRRVAAVWQRALGSELGIHDNFFDLGGNSLVGVQVMAELSRELGLAVSTVALFEAPTVARMTDLLAGRLGSAGRRSASAALAPTASKSAPVAPASAAASASVVTSGGREVAIVGMAGRFPGASDVWTLWSNLCAGRESISFFTEEELAASGIDPAVLADPSYVRARPIIADADRFDARFFGFSPREALFMDPQHRVFFECSSDALETAGYDPLRYPGAIGMFAGSTLNTYLLGFYSDRELRDAIDPMQMVAGNDKDSLPTAISYRLNLRGPSLAVQTHCSTSLVAVHLACQSLLSEECSMALAGGVSVRAPQRFGYRYQEGGQESADGHTRAFDARATGTVFGDGAAVVVLKRLADALADGDTIYAVIKGSSINNDGSLKAGFTAPSVEGQALAVEAALARAGVSAESISYVEAHGSATPLGDPIEVAALTRAFRRSTGRQGFCALGSVKTNIGHIDRAAGAAGLIKTALALRDGVIPPSLHFESPNPELGLAESPFFVNTELRPWPAGDGPRRAGVNSLGMGGTNAHVILEEAPPAEASGRSRPWQLLPLAARSPAALEAAAVLLAAALERSPEVPLADVAYTLQVGRRQLEHRRVVLCADREGALAALAGGDPQRVWSHAAGSRRRSVAFLLPGLGDHYPGMALGLYRREPAFRRHFDRCAEAVAPFGVDLVDLLYPETAAERAPAKPAVDLRSLLGRGEARDRGPLSDTVRAHAALFAVEYALARLWMEWGLTPDAMLGYSLGEYVAACLAGVMELDAALRLVCERARLIDELPEGGMLAVPLAPAELGGLLAGELAVAAINGPELCVVSGPAAALEALAARCAGRGIACRRLEVERAFHSAALEAIVPRLLALFAGVELSPPQIPYVANLTGTWVTPGQATDPRFWAAQMCGTVLFEPGIAALLAEPDRLLLEVGPGQSLTSFVKQHPACAERSSTVFPSLRAAYEERGDQEFLLAALGKLWLAGAAIDWPAYSAGERRRRVALPTYPFERERFWLEPKQQAAGLGSFQELRREPDVADWFYLPLWKQAPPASGDGPREEGPWLILADEGGFSAALAERLERAGRTLVVARGGTGFAALPDGTYRLAPGAREDWNALLRALRGGPGLPRRIVHLWTLDPLPEGPSATRLEHALDRGFYSLIALIQALGELGAAAGIEVVSRGLFPATGEEEIVPELATLAGPCRVLPFEHSGLSCRLIDLAATSAPALDLAAPSAPALDQLAAELEGGREPREPREPIVALRGRQRWVPSYERVRLPGGQRPARLRERGVYLITGGLGGLGLAMAEHLGRTLGARLVLVGRHGLPPRATWQARLAAADATAEKIRRVLAIESAGGEVEVVAADVSRRDQMAAAVRRGVERFGAIDGALHAAGVPGAGIIQLKERAAAAAVLAPKVAGTLVLEEVLAGQAPDFLVLFSSVSAITGGGPGQVDYCAANAFLDAFAHSRSAGVRPILSLDWCEWQWDAWQDGLLGFSPQLQATLRDNRRRLGIRFEEGAEALARALSRALPQLVVSPAPLGRLIELADSFSAADLERETRRGSEAVLPRPVLGTTYEAPASDLESRLAEVWGGLLGVAEIGRRDDFFELGGHSLLATQLFARLRDALEIELPLRAIFEAPTVASLAARIAEARQEGARRELPPIRGLARGGPLPLSFAQERFWFLDQFEAERAVYNEIGALKLAGALDAGALAGVFDEIARRHEVLRTAFPPVEGGSPQAVVLGPEPVPLPRIDLTGLPAAEREREAVRIAAAEGRRTFDLARGRLLAVHLLRLDEREHWLLLRSHHIVWDGESTLIMLREVAALYTAFAAGGASPLPAPPVQYADFAAWQRALLTADASAADLGYWRQRLADAPALLELPTDRPRPAVRSLRGAARSLPLPAELRRSLRELAQRQGVTLFMALLAGYQALLARWADVEDLAIGTPVSGRSAIETEGLVGAFINTLVLRDRIALDADFAVLLGRTRQAVLDAHLHQGIPFERLVDQLAPDRSLSYPPFFQVLFSLQEPPPVREVGGLAAELWDLPVEVTKFDLTLTVAQPDEGLVATLEHLTDLFDGATAERWLAHYAALLQAVTAEPGRALSELSLLGEAERWQLLGEWVGEERPAAEGPRLEEEVRDWAGRTPDAIAAAFESQWLSYAELDGRSDRLSLRLRGLGVGPDARVGLLMEPCLEMPVAVLAVLKAGGAYVPLSLKFPPEQRALVLRDADARVLVTQSPFRAELAGFAGTVLAVDEPDLGPHRVVTVRLRATPSPADAAYLIYTSGSTGRPKGVVVEHRHVLSHLRGIREILPFAPGMRYAMVHPLAVDGSKTLLFGVLGGGGCLHVISADRATDGPALAEYFDRHQIDVLKIAPSHLAALQRTAEPARLMPRRWLMVGGEASRTEWIAELLRLAPGCTLCNHYGPTETAVGVVAHRMDARSPLPTALQAPLGRPLGNVRLHLLDRRLHPVSIGAAGEIHLGGRSVSRGYLGRPDLTAEVFLPDPFAAEPGSRLYKTGDLARFLADGTVEFLGRTDFQVKVRGFRVELREIESHLAQHPSVHDVVVTARADGAGGMRLVAYLVAAPGVEVQAAELRGFLKSRVPEYMLPAAFVALEALPRQAQGKVNVGALPDPAPAAAEGVAAAPLSPVQEQIAAIWCEVLGIERVGLDDDFFALGGHSFLAMQVVSRLRQAFAVEVSLRDLFQAPTIGGLVAAIGSAYGLQAPPLVAVAERPDELPLSFLQERHWLVEQLAESRAITGLAYRLEGPLDLAALARSFDAIVARHSMLRTIVYTVDQRPVQRIVETPPFALRLCDLAALPASRRQEAAAAWHAQVLRIDVPLDRSPLLVVPLLRLSEREHWMVMVVHHIAFDGWSWVVLFGELAALYGELRRGLPPMLPPLPIQYADFALWQRQWFQGEVLGSELAFWKRRLAGAPPLLDALADVPAAGALSAPARAYPVRLDAALAAAVKDLGRRLSVTPFMILLAVYQVLLHCATGREDLSMATYATGRNHLEVEGLMGLFAGLVGLRTRLDRAMSFLAALQEVRRVAAEAFTRQQDLPLQKLISELYPEVDLRHMLQVMFSYRPLSDPRLVLALPDLTVTTLSRGDVAGASELSLALQDGDDGVRGFFLLDGARFLPATGERLARRFELLAAAIAAHPESSLAELDAAVAAAESEQWSRKAEEMQAASLQRLRKSARRSATGSRS